MCTYVNATTLNIDCKFVMLLVNNCLSYSYFLTFKQQEITFINSFISAGLSAKTFP